MNAQLFEGVGVGMLVALGLYLAFHFGSLKQWVANAKTIVDAHIKAIEKTAEEAKADLDAKVEQAIADIEAAKKVV